MKEFIVNTFAEYAMYIIFIHVISAIIWVGGMIAIRLAVHPVLHDIKDPRDRLETTLKTVGNLFHLVIPFIILLIITAVFLAVGLGFKETSLYWLVHLKEVIWTIMTLNFIYMYIKRRAAANLFAQGNLTEARQAVSRLPNLLLPINIFLGVCAVFSGVVLRGF